MSDTDSFNYNLFQEPAQTNAPVECLGILFENDAARRTYFTEKLREKLQDPKFREIEGFPVGEDEDILALSDPPYYTACPNPFLQDFVRVFGKPYDPAVPYHKEPFAADVSEGRNDPIYNAHSYHTKVPHKAIMRYILHYTQPGDVVLDGFSGTGMAGVAAQLCGDRSSVLGLGYTINDGEVSDELGSAISQFGTRYALLNDLSTAATFISYNYNMPINVTVFEADVKEILSAVEAECSWMYETLHTDSITKARINYTVWSDVFLCGECSREIVFYDVAIDSNNGSIRDFFPCPHCNANQTKRTLKRAKELVLDKALGQSLEQIKQVPVLINYSVGKKRYDKKPDSFDLSLISQIASMDIPYWFPIDRMPEGDESRRNDDIGITHVHHYYTKRNLWVLSTFIDKIKKSNSNRVLFLLSALHIHINKMRRYQPVKPGGTPGLPGTLYISAVSVELPLFDGFPRKLSDVLAAFHKLGQTPNYVNTGSAGNLRVSDNSIDYIFTDPPFGNNLMYSELNFLWESWLKVFTNTVSEAIQNKTQGKTLASYQRLMTRCFSEYYRVLKPGRWITIEFHNSKNSVWVSIQEALEQAGFVIADVRTLDKQQGSFKQVTSSGAVKQDLIISAYKPNGGLEKRFELEAGTEAGAWDFVRTHLGQLPIFVSRGAQVQYVVERQNYLLYDRMVAFHVQRGKTVPLSAGEFYAGLAQRFAERDGMYFLPEQVVEYDKKRLLAREVQQIPLIVVDEADAIQWLRQALSSKPQSYSDLYTQFVNQLQTINKHEKLPELSQLLDQNFLRYDGFGDVPSQIHAYLSTNFKELRGLPKENASLRQKAKDRWYVPDPNKSADLEKVREKALLKEFDEYRSFTGRELKQFRLEAVRVGFRKAWQEKDYPIIIQVSQKIPEDVLQEDQKLVMWYDQAKTRMELA